MAAESFRVVVVGAGLSGLSCAFVLKNVFAKRDLVLLDKGNRIGGRLLTQRSDSEVFDVGAQFFTVRSNDFASSVKDWNVAEWCQGFSESDGHSRFICPSGMRGIAAGLGESLPFEKRSKTVVRRVGTTNQGKLEVVLGYATFLPLLIFLLLKIMQGWLVDSRGCCCPDVSRPTIAGARI